MFGISRVSHLARTTLGLRLRIGIGTWFHEANLPQLLRVEYGGKTRMDAVWQQPLVPYQILLCQGMSSVFIGAQ